jgi:adenylosuccinate synthase
MKLDVLAGFEKLRICTGYEVDGENLPHFPADAGVLDQVKPVYEEVGGFAEQVTECRRWDDLPAAAQQYIDLIEGVVGVPVNIVSVGPERSQTLLRR